MDLTEAGCSLSPHGQSAVGKPGSEGPLLTPAFPVQSLAREDPLEEEMATHSSVLTWEIPQTEGPGGLQCLEWQSRTEATECTRTLLVKSHCTFPLKTHLLHEKPGRSEAQRLVFPLPAKECSQDGCEDDMAMRGAFSV